jgi:hypothetical protein
VHGEEVMHVIACCFLCYEKYIDAHGDILIDEYRALCKKHGVELPFYPKKVDVKPMTEVQMPKVNKLFGSLDAGDIVSANPMTKKD